MSAPVPELPDGVVGPVPPGGDQVGDAPQDALRHGPFHVGHVVVAVCSGRHDVAVGVVLALAAGVVADSDRA